MLTITAIETLRLEEFPNLLWVRVHTDEGLIGLGETFFGPRAVEAYVHETAAPRLLGQDALAIERHARTLLHRQYVGFSGSGAEMRGASAIDIALWDLFGKATGQPLWRLLGGLARPKIRTYNTCAGYRYVRSAKGQLTENWGLERKEGPYEDLDAFLHRADELARSLLEQGITAMKIWPFDPAAERWDGCYIAPDELDAALEPFRKIRAAVGSRMDIMVEFHSLWNLPTAKRIFAALEEFEPFWFEDPIKMTDFEALAELAASTRVPITASETLATRPVFRALMARRAVGVVMLDVAWCGGLTEAKKIAALAEAHQLPVAPHDCTGPIVFVASCHLSLSAPNALVQESVRAFYTGWYRELVTELPRIEQGWILPMEGPGLGTDLLPEVFARPDARIVTSRL
ncbi:MAG: mandelate racemase/muconate lactonizing enzyme family protein [Geminicoccaceae bacterium]|nr:mandelate racemase/muconate lactonizing enzyme family protein [Geminicoccaceae bacterium]MCS7268038.1 mandelate racemase/muconate lactonizing enzyme family protein [Geminicoccaceae bacterium]MCX7629811.1 mandelate racemase/muconate lactonizing enzyme family protein [Geminicoccaceae bacterium]MDW8124749.1 mandelate racemase/muconate lactonizing enzyme family protein [Geminicoccaceae bacterium]MDW8341416.1 mandelate racemase/muconate lactonizing enzyme family protein [Geminicoccaceae bacterium